MLYQWGYQVGLSGTCRGPVFDKSLANEDSPNRSAVADELRENLSSYPAIFPALVFGELSFWGTKLSGNQAADGKTLPLHSSQESTS